MIQATLILMLALNVNLAACEPEQGKRRKQSSSPATANSSKQVRQLFNGRDLTGWEHTGPGSFIVENGLLRTEGGMGLLWYTGEKFGNCVVRVVYKTTHRNSNSGVFVRIADRPSDPMYAVHNGYETQILDDTDEFHRTGAIYSLSKPTALPTKPPGEWNMMEISLRGDQIVVHVNGVKVNDFNSKQAVPERKEEWEPMRGPRPETGYIGVQNHDGYARDQNTHVYYKEISVHPLDGAKVKR